MGPADVFVFEQQPVTNLVTVSTRQICLFSFQGWIFVCISPNFLLLGRNITWILEKTSLSQSFPVTAYAGTKRGKKMF